MSPAQRDLLEAGVSSRAKVIGPSPAVSAVEALRSRGEKVAGRIGNIGPSRAKRIGGVEIPALEGVDGVSSASSNRVGLTSELNTSSVSSSEHSNSSASPSSASSSSDTSAPHSSSSSSQSSPSPSHADSTLSSPSTPSNPTPSASSNPAPSASSNPTPSASSQPGEEASGTSASSSLVTTDSDANNAPASIEHTDLSAWVDVQARALMTLPGNQALVRQFQQTHGEFFFEIAEVGVMLDGQRFKNHLLEPENIHDRLKKKEIVKIYRRSEFFQYSSYTPAIPWQLNWRDEGRDESQEYNEE